MRALPPARNPDTGAREPAPAVEGETLDGEQLTAPRAGRPTVLMFLAHWCPHCSAAYGLTNFPFWVVIDADGVVVTREAGELTESQLEALVTAAREGEVSPT